MRADVRTPWLKGEQTSMIKSDLINDKKRIPYYASFFRLCDGFLGSNQWLEPKNPRSPKICQSTSRLENKRDCIFIIIRVLRWIVSEATHLGIMKVK